VEILKKILKNGIRVIMEKRELPLVSLSISNKFGAAFEDKKIKGLAHFIEHLVFTGTKTRTHEDISREIEKKGGIINAFTSHELTSFWFKLPSEHVFAGLDILCDILNNPIFDLQKFEKEKKVILEEIKMYHDSPQRFVHDLIEKKLYAAPFGNSIIGSKETVSSLKRDFVAPYFKRVYVPSNLVVVIVGNANFDKVCDYLEKQFPKAGEFSMKEPKIVKQRGSLVEKRGAIDQTHYIFAMHSPLPWSNEYYALEVLDAYLANGMSSRLFLKIREERGLAYAVRSNLNAEKNYSYYSIYVGTKREAVKEVEKLILEEFINVKNLTEKELKESQERLIGLRRVSSEESINVMNELAFAALADKEEEYYEHERRIKAVTLRDVKELAAKLANNYSTAVIVPK